jgi:hypothetical protein
VVAIHIDKKQALQEGKQDQPYSIDPARQNDADEQTYENRYDDSDVPSRESRWDNTRVKARTEQFNAHKPGHEQQNTSNEVAHGDRSSATNRSRPQRQGRFRYRLQ